MLDDVTYFTRKNLVEPVKTVDNNLCQSSMRILDCFFTPYIENEIKRITKDEIAKLESMIPELFIFSFIWSIGTTTTLEGRLKFDKFFREKIKQLGIDFPEDNLVYDYKYNVQTQEW
mmetsp:Transcript_21556/g.15736  ORF Transcript_21556/g.15736 Transcript_21556/m.15736 type:complete len:117 (-) Transcript_21556:943-1293(-)